MKFNYHVLVVFALLCVSACNQNPSGNKNTGANAGSSGQHEKAESDVAKVLFKEGKIDLKITTPGTPLGELLQQVDPTKGNVPGQIKTLAAKLSAKDREILEAQNKKSGTMNLAILMLPLKSVIYIKGDEATAKFDALTFHGENNVNETDKAGMIYMKSQNNSKAMTISYTGESFKEMAQNELKAADYDVKKTNETSIVAGYKCTKYIYTLKKPISANAGGLTKPSIYQLEVWTSTEMPKSSTRFI